MNQKKLRLLGVALAAALLLPGCGEAELELPPEESPLALPSSEAAVDEALLRRMIEYSEAPQPEDWWYVAKPLGIELEYGGEESRRVRAPIELDESTWEQGFAGYVTKPLTALVYGGLQAGEPVEVHLSLDRGGTWETVTVPTAEGEVYLNKWIGFTSPKEGWLVMGGHMDMGHQNHYVYLTHDGGATWAETGNVTGQWNVLLNGGGFLNERVGFLAFGHRQDDAEPVLYRTGDGGASWERMELALPEGMDYDYAEPRGAPLERDGVCLLPIYVRQSDSEGPSFRLVYNWSVDEGKTWRLYEGNLG